MTTFAKNTTVPVERSRAELEKTIRRFGGTRFVSGWTQTEVLVGFELGGRAIKITVPLSQDRSQERRDRVERQRWRALILVVKAKLEAVESGISSFETEFLGHIVLPSGKTVGELLAGRVNDLALPPGPGPADPHAHQAALALAAYYEVTPK